MLRRSYYSDVGHPNANTMNSFANCNIARCFSVLDGQNGAVALYSSCSFVAV